jgi:hypothetical protein
MADPSQEEAAAAAAAAEPSQLAMEDLLHGVRLDIPRTPSGQLFFLRCSVLGLGVMTAS